MRCCRGPAVATASSANVQERKRQRKRNAVRTVETQRKAEKEQVMARSRRCSRQSAAPGRRAGTGAARCVAEPAAALGLS